MKTPKSNKSKRLFEALSVIGIILVITLVFVIQMRMKSPAIMATATHTIALSPLPDVTSTAISEATFIPLLTPTTALPTAAPIVANGQEPPPCTFPLAQITTTESAPESYTFSEPKVVLTAPKGNFYHIIQ